MRITVDKVEDIDRAVFAAGRMLLADRAAARPQYEALDCAMAYIEETFDCADGPAGPEDEAGHPYVVIGAGGEKKEGEPHMVFCTDAETLVRLWMREIFDRASAMVGRVKIRWRTRPEIDVQYWERGPIRTPIYVLYSRLSMYVADEPKATEAVTEELPDLLGR